MVDEIIQEFCQETGQILTELESILEELDQAPLAYHLLETFGQKVDRVMGAAKSLELSKMGIISEFCKMISYKAAQSKNKEILAITTSFLCDAVEAMREIHQSLIDTHEENVNPVMLKTLLSRLKFITGKLEHIERSSVAITEEDLNLMKKKS